MRTSEGRQPKYFPVARFCHQSLISQTQSETQGREAEECFEAAFLSSSPAQLPLLSPLGIFFLMISAFTFSALDLFQAMLSHSGSGPYNDKNPLSPPGRKTRSCWTPVVAEMAADLGRSSPKSRRLRASVLVESSQQRPDSFPFVCRQCGAGAAAFSHP